MSDALLFERLDELVDDCAGARGDWDDVLRRAENAARLTAPRRRLRRPSRRVLAWGVAVASLLVIFFATPAFGLLRNWIGRKDVPFTGKTAPFVVKRNFADMSIGSPPGMAPQAIAGQTRKVGVFHAFGRAYLLYVVPTRNGAFCWMFGGSSTCPDARPVARTYPHMSGAVNPYLLSTEIGMNRVSRRGSAYRLEIDGVVYAKNAASLSVEYEDHTSVQIPFVYVSKPIDAGFFLYGIPPTHYRSGNTLVAVSAHDSQGKLIARVPMSVARLFTANGVRPRQPLTTSSAVRPPRLLPQPLPALKPPLQHGQAEGVAVVAGKNGAVVIDVSRAEERVRALIGRGAGWDCFSFFGPYHLSDPAGIGMSLPNGVEKNGLRMLGIPAPFAGCEVTGTYGRRWPDRFHSHEAVEIAFTTRARTYFADRAAARDLALFVQLLRIRGIRGLSGDALDSAISSEFGTKVAHLSSVFSSLAPGDVGFVDRSGGAAYIEHSTTGRRFSVTIESGKIVAQNLRGRGLMTDLN